MLRTLGLVVAAGALVTACAHTPKSQAKRMELESQASATLEEMMAKDPGLQSLIDQSAGYVVFPVIKQGGAIVGGASGSGVVFEGGRPTGFAELSQASLGLQLGGQKFAELVIVRDRFTLDKMKSGSFDVGGQASAVILKQGAASATQFSAGGIAVVVEPKGGAMFNLSLTGQRVKFKG